MTIIISMYVNLKSIINVTVATYVRICMEIQTIFTADCNRLSEFPYIYAATVTLIMDFKLNYRLVI